MVETAGVEPTVVLTDTRVCSGLPNAYRISKLCTNQNYHW